MTLVARFYRGDVPFVVGDLLLSTPSWKDVNANMPTIPRRAQAMVGVKLGSQEWAPSQLVQKVILLNDNVVVGWAGRMDVARPVIGQLRKELADADNVSQLDEALNHVSDAALQEMDILGFARLGDRLYPFNAGTKIVTIESPEFRDLTLTGSGRDSFQKRLGGKRAFRMHECDDWTQAVIDVMQVLGSTISWEMMTQETLMSLYGGGFEVAFISQGKFRKFEDTLYTVWQATFVGDEISVDFLHMFKYAYDNEDLVIRVVDVDQKTNSGLDPAFHVPPVDSKKPHEVLLAGKVPDMPSKCVMILVIVADADGNPRGSFSLFLVQPDLDYLYVEFREGSKHAPGLRYNSNLRVEMNDVVLGKVYEMARNGRKQGIY